MDRIDKCIKFLSQLRKKIELKAKPTENVRWDIRLTT